MKTLSNKFMHLTNYSVNKKNSEYQTNSDEQACQGHKWYQKDSCSGRRMMVGGMVVYLKK